MQMNVKINRRADIAARAMLVSFSVSQWTAHKRDKKTSAEIAETKGAKRDSGNYNKVLIGRENLAAVAAIVQAARQDHIFMSLPWMNDGTRILPVQAFTKYAETMRKHREAFESAVSEFVAQYPDYIQQARQDLGELFNPDDYPMRQEIAGKFKWSIGTLPMPDAADFRVDLDQATVLQMQAEMQDQIGEALRAATADAFSRLYDVVQAMASKLAAYDPAKGKQGNPFRDSLVSNMRELLEIMPSLNLTGDSALETAIATARDRLAIHEAQDLRDNAELRKETATEAAKLADEIADAMGGFFG